MISRPAELTSAILNKAVGRYYKELQDYASQAEHELALRPAFQNLLAEMARRINLTLVHEMTIRGRIRPDGVLCNAFNIRLGYWEAKGPKGNLEVEIQDKIKAGYPLENALFENTRQAILYQAGQRYNFNLQVQADVTTLLRRFLTYQKPDIANFEQAVIEFQEQIPNIAKRLLELINEEQQRNRAFVAALGDFTELCRTTLNPHIGQEEIKEMLIQHLLTERLFRTVFNNPDFVHQNVIASKIEQVIQVLTSRSFNRNEFLRSLDPFYGAVEGAARGIETWSERQHFLNTVYERFFQGFSVQKADTHGIVYTPQEIVNFMVASVAKVLLQEFGKSLATPGVKILDPATGTGNFIVNIIKHIPRSALREKYADDLFCNEIMLLPYYISSLNIEHEYYDKIGEYVPFQGICFADTLELAEGQQLTLFTEDNTERVQREKDADIMVVIGNPPYNVGQKNQNDNNKNRPYPVIDQRIRETYAKSSRASNKNALSDAYVKFFRWATDRLQGHDGIVCYVSNNSLIDQIAFDGMRKHLLQDFTRIYHLDLHGNVRQNPKLSGTTHNVFGIQVGVGITIAIRNSQHHTREIYYYRVPEFWRKTEKLAFLTQVVDFTKVEWQILQPDKYYNWLTEGLRIEFALFQPLGNKETKGNQDTNSVTIFKNYGRGVATCRDDWAYNYDRAKLMAKIKNFIEVYNAEVDHWRRRGNSNITIDAFVTYEDTKIKWSRDLKLDLQRGHYAEFSETKVRTSMYRPFCKRWLFFDRVLNEEVYQFPHTFPNKQSELDNAVICLSGIGSSKPFHCLAVNCIPDLHLTGDAQCFPYYTYNEDGTNRHENITGWTLKQFQAKYGEQVSKWDIFHYVYAMLHHPQYRERYAENLKRDLPHIPLLRRAEAYQTAVKIGQILMDLHVRYEQQKPYPLTAIEDETIPYEQLTCITKMKLTPDRTAVVVSKGLTLAGIPDACFRYRLGNRSALEWAIDQYQVSTDTRSGITSDPNRLDDPEYIVRLVKQVVTVSVETVELVDQLAQGVTMEDWMERSEKNTNEA